MVVSKSQYAWVKNVNAPYKVYNVISYHTV
jgi:hypothetical protein